MEGKKKEGTVSWPELYLVLENAELAARQEVRTAGKGAGASERELWKAVDHAATEAARKAVGPRKLSPPSLRLVLDAAEVANLEVR